MKINASVLVVFVLLALPFLGGCVQYRSCCPPPCAVVASVPTPEPEPPPAPKFKVYDGATGEPADLRAVVDSWGDADLVVFGELHGHSVGSAMQLQILETMAGQGRPVALAMEFLERDVQPTVDAYLAGDLDEETFVKEARQNEAYPKTHRPLVELCKEHGFPVIAANAPRKLVSAYRKAEGDYATFVSGLSEEEQATLPRETSVIEDAYHDRFMKLMGPERGPSFFRSQSLWDDAMAEAIADFRNEHPDHRVFFVVGGFHVQGKQGTITKYEQRRSGDEVRLVQMALDNERHLPFDEEELGTGDLVVNVPVPKRPKPKGPNPHAATKKMPKAMPKMPKTHPEVKPKEGAGS